MDALVLCHGFKQLRDLLVSLLSGFVGIEEIFISGHGLPAESGQQILFGTGAFQFHSDASLI